MDQANEDLRHIRSIMERSSRFLSLSGLSGVFAGIYALAGAWVARWYLTHLSTETRYEYYDFSLQSLAVHGEGTRHLVDFYTFFILDAGSVLILSLLTGFLLTRRKAAKAGLKVWDPTSKRMLINLGIPLVTGGLFCLIMLWYNNWYLVAPATLIFYGLALINASKYTFNDIRYLGVSEIILGLVAAFFVPYSLWFWALGFGVLHIIYGVVMWARYER
ncbi:MAG: hypothetical protein IT233_09445 [Bacteroidia bacterium]|nr:hypothetical protein [Bacteroidia bacterium]